MNQKLLRLPKVIEITGLSKSGIYLQLRKGNFPSPVKLTGRSKAWKQSDVEAWIESRPYARG